MAERSVSFHVPGDALPEEAYAHYITQGSLKPNVTLTSEERAAAAKQRALEHMTEQMNTNKEARQSRMTKGREEHQATSAKAEVSEEVGRSLPAGTQRVTIAGNPFTIPNAPEELEVAHNACLNRLATRLGIESGKFSESLQTTSQVAEAATWQNSAKSTEELIEDSTRAAPVFLRILEATADKASNNFYCGPNNQHVTKTPESLRVKVYDDMNDPVKGPRSEETCIQRIGDCVRGSLIVDTPEEARALFPILKQECENTGGSLIFKNLYTPKANGYFSVHAIMKMKIPEERTPDGKIVKEARTILCEVQIHLSTLYSADKYCTKELTHMPYKQESQLRARQTELRTEAVALRVLANKIWASSNLQQDHNAAERAQTALMLAKTEAHMLSAAEHVGTKSAEQMLMTAQHMRDTAEHMRKTAEHMQNNAHAIALSPASKMHMQHTAMQMQDTAMQMHMQSTAMQMQDTATQMQDTGTKAQLAEQELRLAQLASMMLCYDAAMRVPNENYHQALKGIQDFTFG